MPLQRALLLALAASGLVGCANDSRPPQWFRAEEWGARRIEFDQKSWAARESLHPTGAGPNRWSSSSESVFVDEAGHLHLRLIRRDSGWASAEVSTPLPDDYGQMTVELATDPASIDSAAIAAAFVYRNDQSEIDVELGRWGDPSQPDAQFVVAPAMPADRLKRFELPLGSAPVTFVIDWSAERVAFSARPQRGPPQTWAFRGSGRPEPGGHRLHLALWLREPSPRGDGSVEIVVKSASVVTPQRRLNSFIWR